MKNAFIICNLIPHFFCSEETIITSFFQKSFLIPIQPTYLFYFPSLTQKVVYNNPVLKLAFLYISAEGTFSFFF